MSGSGPDRRKKIPEAPKPVAAAGNLLSNVAPPSQLPNFITAPIAQSPENVSKVSSIKHSFRKKPNLTYYKI